MNYITTDKFNRTVRGDNLSETNGQATKVRPSQARDQKPRAICESEIEAIFHWAYFDGSEDEKITTQQ